MNAMLNAGRKLAVRTLIVGSAAMLFTLTLTTPRALAQSGEGHATPEASSARAPRTYRLVYTVTHYDGQKSLGAMHYAMTIVTNGRAQLKQGSKEPVMTGGYAHDNTLGTTQYQFTYIDVGLNLDARLTEVGDGLQLTSKVENSSITDTPNSQAMKDPAVMQAVLENSTMIRPGVPVVIGSLDFPGGTKHVEVQVELQRVP